MHKRRVYQRQKPKMPFVFLLTWNPSQKIKVIQLLTVTENVPLDLTGVDPGHKVLHVTCNQESWVIDNLSTDTDVALLDESGSLLSK
jgi:hypothetical protein